MTPTTDEAMRNASMPMSRKRCRAATLSVPFLPLHAALSASHAWRNGTARGDGVHPDAAGYAALAALVDAWPAWRTLTGG